MDDTWPMPEWSTSDGRQPITLRLDGFPHNLTIAQAMELVRSAPKMAGRWTQRFANHDRSERWVRVDAEGAELASIQAEWWRRTWSQPQADCVGWEVLFHGYPHGWCESVEAAKSAADAALRSAGYLLDDGGE